jgi:hypothetical protein
VGETKQKSRRKEITRTIGINDVAHRSRGNNQWT